MPPPTGSPHQSPKEQRGIGCTLFVTLLVIIILGIAAFVLMRPGSSSNGANNPSSPMTQH